MIEDMIEGKIDDPLLRQSVQHVNNRRFDPSMPRVPAALAGALGVILLATGCSDATTDRAPPARAERPAVPVVVEALQLRPSQTTVETVGTARAKLSVSLFAEAAGEVVELNFQPGDFVAQGQTLLALDARDEKLALELAELRLEDATRTLNRYTRANAGAELTVPETTVDTARTALHGTRIERDIAALALQRRIVTAPFDGFVGITDIDVGDRIDTTTEITSIDDRSALLVNFDVPEAFVGSLQSGDPIRIEAWRGTRSGAEGRVVDIGSRVDPLTRSFTARAEVDNREDKFRPGMSFRVELTLTGDSFPAVPEVALQWGAEGSYIWVVEDSIARRIPASLVQRQGRRVLVEADVAAGAEIVGEGVQSMREGLRVRTMDADALARDARAILTPVTQGD